MGIDLVLRTSLVWNGEVMEDRVLDRPEPVTLGARGKPTFVTPDLGLPDEFAIVRPGAKGYLLVLGDRMRGAVCLGGVQRAVEELVANEPFAATPLQVGDWGVIQLDDTGSCQLFFQFVPREEHAVILTRKQLNIGAIGFGVFSVIGAAVFAAKGLDFGEALFRSIGLTALIFGAAVLCRAIMKQDGESKASLGFSIILHTAVLSFTFHVYAEQSAFAFPEQRQLTATYLTTRPADPGPVLASIKTTPTLGPIAGAAAMPVTETPAPARGDDGGAGASRPRPNRASQPPSPFGILGNPDLMALAKRDVGRDVGRLVGVTGAGPNRGEAGPPGPRTRSTGRDPRGPVGTHRPGEEIGEIAVRGVVCVGAGCGGGTPIEVALPPPPVGPDDSPRLTAKEIDDVVKRRSGIFRACYQKQVNRTLELAGTVVMRWRITPSGDVVNAKRHAGTLTNADVVDCITLNVGALKFPAKGGATVTYPFVFRLGS
jgi:hypothetical protein